MKKIIFLFLILTNITLLAQYNQDAPWMQSLQSKNGNATMAEMIDAFDNYCFHL